LITQSPLECPTHAFKRLVIMVIKTQCITLTEDNFQAQVLEIRVPVLVDCWASWCSSFQWINPLFEKLEIAFAGQIVIGRLNVATSDKLAAQYGIRAVPTLLLFQDGYLLERMIGSISEQDLTRKLDAMLAAQTLGSRSEQACARELNTIFPVRNSSRSRIACL